MWKLVIVMMMQMLRLEPSTIREKHHDPRVQVTVVEQGAPIEGPGAPKPSATTVSNRNILSEIASHAGMIETKVYFELT